jgi:hypothetical protein
MDLGIYKRNRFGIWSWILGPALLTALVHGTVGTWERCASADLRRQRTVLELMPAMQEKLELCGSTVRRFDGGAAGGGKGMDALSGDLGREAEQCGLDVVSLSITEVGGSEEHVACLQVAMKARGPLPSYIMFCNELHRPERLTSVDSMALTGSELGERPVYAGSLVFTVGVVSP